MGKKQQPEALQLVEMLAAEKWHSSGMLHGKMSKHIHSCDACAARAPADSVQDDLITIRKPTTSAEMLLLLKLAHLVISDVGKTLEESVAPAQPAAQQGAAYAALPDLSDADGEIWRAIIYWGHAERGEDALRKASELERVLSDQMRAFADATHTLRASHGQAPAAPKGDIDD